MALFAVGDSQRSVSGDEKCVELYWVFSLAAAALLLVEIYLTIRRYRRNRIGGDKRLSSEPVPASFATAIARSGPCSSLCLVVAYKLISVVVSGQWAASALTNRDVDALRDDVGTLEVFDVVESDKTAFWAANLAALEGGLAEADSRFSAMLTHTDVCPVRVNLELVRETDGDLAARGGDTRRAEQRYRDALAVVDGAPQGCFEGNGDPDADRRAVRNNADARLADKINALRTPLPPAPAAPAPVVPAPAPPPSPPPVDASAALAGVDPDWLPGEGPPPALRLEPGEAGEPARPAPGGAGKFRRRSAVSGLGAATARTQTTGWFRPLLGSEHRVYALNTDGLSPAPPSC